MRYGMVVCVLISPALIFWEAAPVHAQGQKPAPAASPAGQVQNYPARPVRIVVPWPPGGAADNVARVISQKITQTYGYQTVVDNRAGAGSIIGTEIVAKSPPDGYTLLDAAAAHSINPALNKLPFDTVKDFAPITMLMVTPNLLVAHPSLPAKSIKELIALAKAYPGQLTFASAGVGSSPHMAGELFNYLAKVNMVHVPYKGGGPAVTDLMGGHVQLFFSSIATTMPYLKGGKVKGIAVTSAKRSRSAPEFPTIAESGIPGYELYEWNALFAPAGTPADIIAKLNADFGKVLAAADVQEKLFEFGAEPTSSTADQLQSHVVREMAKWDKVVKAMGIKAQ